MQTTNGRAEICQQEYWAKKKVQKAKKKICGYKMLHNFYPKMKTKCNK